MQAINAKMSWWFVLAAVANLATIFIHVQAGAPEIIAPILSADLPVLVKGVADVLWHHITAMLVLAAVACLWAARHHHWRRPVALLMGAQYLLIAALFIGFNFYWFSSPWVMPQWVLFGAMAALMAVGAWRGPRTA